MKKITLLFITLFSLNSFAQAIFEDDFENETIDATTFANWISTDSDADGNYWEVSDVGAYAVANAPNHPMSSLAADSDSWEGSGFTPDNFLTTSSPIDLSGVTGTQISFVVGSYQTNGQFTDDLYAVYLSTSNDPADIINETPITLRYVTQDALCDLEDGSNSAGTVSLDASSYDGQSVYLTFRHYDTFDMNSVLIDDVMVGSNLSTEVMTIENFKYFIDGNSQLNISSNNIFKNIYVYSILGKQVVNQELNSYSEVINLSNLSKGIYIARFVCENSSEKSIKIVLK